MPDSRCQPDRPAEGYRFRGLELHLAARELRDEAGPLPIEPKVFDLLAYLARHRDRAVSRALHEALEPHAGRINTTGGVICFGSAGRLVGLLASTLERYDEAAERFDTALAVDRSLGARPTAVLGALALASTLARRGSPSDTDRAWRLVEQAEQAADSMGMGASAPRAASVRALLRSSLGLR